MTEKDYKYIPEATILKLKIKDVVESKPSGLLKVICNIKDKSVWVPPSIADYASIIIKNFIMSKEAEKGAKK